MSHSENNAKAPWLWDIGDDRYDGTIALCVRWDARIFLRRIWRFQDVGDFRMLLIIHPPL